MTITATGNAATGPGVSTTPLATGDHAPAATAAPATDGGATRPVSTALYDLVLGVERHRVDLARELQLGTTDVAALWEIARTPGLRPGDLARALGLGDAGTSSVVDKLVKSGFARRVPHPTDRRSLNLELTPAGRHAHGWIDDQLDRIVLQALHDDPDLGALAGQLTQLAHQFATPRP